jgi:hypothetical protein
MGETLSAIHQSIEIAAPVADVRAAWPRFLEWVLAGSRRFSCGQLACVDAVDSGAVSFEGDSSTTRVTFVLDREGAAGLLPEEQLTRDLRHDLDLFKRYYEEHLLTAVARRLRAVDRREQDEPPAKRWFRRARKDRGGNEREPAETDDPAARLDVMNRKF